MVQMWAKLNRNRTICFGLVVLAVITTVFYTQLVSNPNIDIFYTYEKWMSDLDDMYGHETPLSFKNVNAIDNYPNFLFIMADDMGWGDTSYNNGTAYTPFLDSWTKMANTITFWRGYSGSPICSPSRASVLSGRTANRECVYHPNGCGGHSWKCTQPMPLPHSTTTIADVVKFANPNYKTKFFGKWHLGDLWRKPHLTGHHGMCNPGNVGFDDWIATHGAVASVMPNCGCFKKERMENSCAVGHYGFKRDGVRHGGPWCSNYWYPESNSKFGVKNVSYKIDSDDAVYIVDQFENWLQNMNNNGKNDSKNDSTKQPFLAVVFFHQVHAFFIATNEWREACANGTSCRLSKNGEYSSAQLDYFGSLNSMDSEIKRIRNLLLKYNVLNNTLIWFTSDNGPAGDHEKPWGSTKTPGSTNGLRGRKHDVFEGGIREPMIIEWNGVIKNKNGFNSTFPIVNYDFMTTILDVLNININSKWSLDGMSLLSMFKNPLKYTERYKPIGWNYHDSAAWMDNEWKLVLNSKNNRKSSDNVGLYNIELDPFETRNLINNQSTSNISDKMKHELTQWLLDVDQSQYHDSKCLLRRSGHKRKQQKQDLDILLNLLK